MKKCFGFGILAVLGCFLGLGVAGCDTVCLTAPLGGLGLTGCNGSGPGSGNGDSNPGAPGQPGPLAMTGTPTINGALYVDGVPVNIYSGNALCIDLQGAFTGGRGPWRMEILRSSDESLVLGRIGLGTPATCFPWADLDGRLSSGFYIIMLTSGDGYTLKWLIQIVVVVVNPNPQPSDPEQPVIQIAAPVNNSMHGTTQNISFVVNVLSGVPPFNYHWLFADSSIIDVSSHNTSVTVLKSFALPNDTGLNFVEVTDATGLKSEIQQVRVIIH